MTRRRTLIAATLLGLLAALTVPAAASAHELVWSEVGVDGNYLMAETNTEGAVVNIRFDVYDGKLRFDKGKPIDGALVNARTRDYRSEITGDTCTIEVEEWIAETSIYPPGTNVVFLSPYAGSLSVDLVMHGNLTTYDGVVVTGETSTWCERGEETSVADLGLAALSVEANWSSQFVGPEKKPKRVDTTIEFTNLTWNGSDLVPIVDEDPDEKSPIACSMPRRTSAELIEFVDNH